MRTRNSALGVRRRLWPIWLLLLAESGAAATTDNRLVLITTFNPTNCIAKGASVSLLGSNFGSASGRGVALGGQGIHVDTEVLKWNATLISIRIPDDPRIQSGRQYYLGIERDNHTEWLSNIDRLITICPGSNGSLSGIGLPPSALDLTAPGTGKNRVKPLFREGSLQPSVTPQGPATPVEKGTGDTADLASDDLAPPSEPQDSQMPSNESGPGGGFAASVTDSVLPQSSYGSLLSAPLPPVPDLPPDATETESSTVEPAELLVIHTDSSLAGQFATSIQGMGFSIKRRRTLKGLGLVLSVIRLPAGRRVGESLRRLRNQLPDLWVDANHRYALAAGNDAKSYSHRMTGWQPAPAICGAVPKIGMVDTGIARDHPTLRGVSLTQKSFLPAGVAAASTKHGTAIAALLVGEGGMDELPKGLLPTAQLYVAAVFRARGEDTQETTAERIVYALDWLLRQGVGTINLSLGGPRNLLLEAALQRLMRDGVAVAAAAGNGGAGGKAVYPAAQTGVVAVTAVDAKARLYRQASRAPYVAFSAPGVDIWSANSPEGGAYFSGTSFAVPFVTAALAIRPRQISVRAMVDRLVKSAIDLGKPGRDSDFGWGLIQSGAPCR